MQGFRGRRAIALIAVLALAGLGGCGNDDDKAATTGDTAAEGGPQTVRVLVDPKPDAFNASFIHYFPEKLQAHAGDTVQYVGDFTGEVHTVTAGSMIKPLLDVTAKYKDVKEPPPEAEEEFGKAFGSVPQAFNPEELGKGGDPFIQAAWEPCFYATGTPPIDKACDAEHQKQPDAFHGTEVLYNAGYVGQDTTFDIKLADDIAPGDYVITCLFHGPEMTSTITVVPEATKVPSPAEVEAAANAELDGFVAKLQGPVDTVRKNTKSPGRAGAAVEGEDGPPGEANVFPDNIAVKAGESVTWNGIGFHTVTFNATEDMRPAFGPENGKGLHLNQKAFKPVNSPAYPPDPEGGDEGGPPGPPDPSKEKKLDAGSYSGSGLKHSGINPGEATYGYTVKFPKAGTYEYICVVHPDMEGKVTVS
ncbi:MAG TPA: hypothetical protein VM030_07895 [Acidimicrobiales bacterium]|nr:hypothetical protein [Acidimicrobiales bacterium]